MSIPLVSISCITYNHVNYFKHCLGSLLMQKTNFAYEILIYDDGSQANTAAIIRKYESKFPDKIKSIYQTVTHYSKELVYQGFICCQKPNKNTMQCIKLMIVG